MIITKEWIDKKGACSDGAVWGKSIVGEGMALEDILPKFERADWLLWTLSKTELFTKTQLIWLSIVCAKTVLNIYERKHQKDKRPRKSIEAAIAYAKRPTKANCRAAHTAASASAAASAASYASAAYTAAFYAASAAAYAAHTAAYAASASAAYAAASASAAASAASYASASAKKMHHKKMCRLILAEMKGPSFKKVGKRGQ